MRFKVSPTQASGRFGEISGSFCKPCSEVVVLQEIVGDLVLLLPLSVASLVPGGAEPGQGGHCRVKILSLEACAVGITWKNTWKEEQHLLGRWDFSCRCRSCGEAIPRAAVVLLFSLCVCVR